MAALTADARTPNIVPAYTEFGCVTRDLNVASATVIYKHGWVGLNAAGALIMQASPTVGTTVVGGSRFVGLSLEHVSAAQSTAGKRCKVMVQGTVRCTIASSDAGTIGKPVFCSDSGVLGLAALGNAYVGFVQDFVATDGVDECIVWVDGFRPQMSGTISMWSPIITLTAANIVRMIPASMNANGLFINRAFGVCTTSVNADATVLLQDEAAVSSGVSLATVATSGCVAGDKIIDVGSLQTTAAGIALTSPHVAAGKALDLLVSVPAATAGAAKYWIECIPAV